MEMITNKQHNTVIISPMIRRTIYRFLPVTLYRLPKYINVRIPVMNNNSMIVIFASAVSGLSETESLTPFL